MWQRLQTLYLGIACFLTGALFFSRLATIAGPEGTAETIYFHEKLVYLLLTIMVFTGNVICLFTFKVRYLQMRLAVMMALMLLGFEVLVGIDIVRNNSVMAFKIAAVYPLVSAILDILAARCIALDEAMVQSAARLRTSRKKRK